DRAPADVGRARALAPAQIAGHLAARRHVDAAVPVLLDVRDAGVHVARAHVLAIAEQGAFRLLALHGAAAFEVGVALDVTVDVRGRRAGAVTALLAVRLARGRGPGTARVAVGVAACGALLVAARQIALGVAARLALGVAARRAVERAGVA